MMGGGYSLLIVFSLDIFQCVYLSMFTLRFQRKYVECQYSLSYSTDCTFSLALSNHPTEARLNKNSEQA